MTDAPSGPTTTRLSFTSVSRSHPGLRRATNQDRVLARPEAGLWAVADGMGGYREGDMAASRLVEELAGVAAVGAGYTRLMDAAGRVERVNAELFELAARDGPVGSTLVVLLTHQAHYACLWVGDSRAYRLRDGELLAITRDHSVVQELVEHGLVNDAQRRDHPNTNIITRAVGAARELKLDHRFAPIEDGDVFLLCSDGLTSCLGDAEIARSIQTSDLDTSADRLLSATFDRGASDNVSFVLIRACSVNAKCALDVSPAPGRDEQ